MLSPSFAIVNITSPQSETTTCRLRLRSVRMSPNLADCTLYLQIRGERGGNASTISAPNLQQKGAPRHREFGKPVPSVCSLAPYDGIKFLLGARVIDLIWENDCKEARRLPVSRKQSEK